MHCPSCKCPETRVLESRHDSKEMIRRRRQCTNCGLRVTTEEYLRMPRSKKELVRAAERL